MKKKLIFVSILVILLSIGTIEAESLKILSKDELGSIKGINLITDLKFRNMFIAFMYEDSKPDFEKIYPFLS